MRPRRARHVVLLAVLMSVGLTAVTIWAVVSQSRALRAREWANLENDARAVASERLAALRADLERWLDFPSSGARRSALHRARQRVAADPLLARSVEEALRLAA